MADGMGGQAGFVGQPGLMQPQSAPAHTDPKHQHPCALTMMPRFRAADSARGAAARVPRAATAAVAAPHAPTSTSGLLQRAVRSDVRRCSATTASREEESSGKGKAW